MGNTAFDFVKEQLSRQRPTLDRSREDDISFYTKGFEDHYRVLLEPYFEHIYHMLEFVDSVDSSAMINKIFYMNLMRAQLSSSQLFLLFYHGLSKYGTQLKPLVEQYHLLERMPRDSLPLFENEAGVTERNYQDVAKYEKTAFGAAADFWLKEQ